jgi:AraC-like DNA-binding protein
MRCVTVIRSASLRGFRATIAELGGNAEQFAEVVGLPITALDTDDLLIPVQTASAVLDYAATKLGCPDLGLRIATRQDLSMLGPLALAIQASATIGEALTCATRYVFVHNRSITLTVEPDPYHAPGVTALQYGAHVAPPIHDQGIDLGMSLVHRVLTELAGGRYGLRSVELPHRPQAPLAVYEEFFGAPVRVERPVGFLRIPTSLLRKPLQGADPHIHQLAEAFLAERLPKEDRELAPRVRAAIQQILGTATADIATVGAMVAMHPRTVQRRLAQEDTSFGALLDDVRRHAARRFLTRTQMPMTQVADLLGFSEQSALSRSCQRWWQTTPTKVRRDHALAT